MTTRHAGYVVTLKEDIREDFDETIKAIQQIKGVLEVEPIASDVNLQIAKKRAKQEMINEIWELLKAY